MAQTSLHVKWGKALLNDPRLELGQEFLSALHDFGNVLGDLARSTILEQRSSGFEIEWKTDGSPVSSADKNVEQALREMIAEAYPAHGVVGEEFEDHQLEAEFVWVLDPIDGTEEFINGVPLYGSMICLLYKQTPVVAVLEHPELDYRVSGAFGCGSFLNGKQVTIAQASDAKAGQERIFCAAQKQFERDTFGKQVFEKFCRKFSNYRMYYTCFGSAAVTAGSFDAGIEYGLHIWDSVPSWLLITEAGGKCEIIQESRDHQEKPLYGFVFGKPDVVDSILETVR